MPQHKLNLKWQCVFVDISRTRLTRVGQLSRTRKMNGANHVKSHLAFVGRADMTSSKSDASVNTTIGEGAGKLLTAVGSDAESSVTATSQEDSDTTKKGKVIKPEEQDTKAALVAAELAAARAGRPLPPPLKPTWKSVPSPENFTPLETDAIDSLLKMRYPPIPRPAYSPLTPPARKFGDKKGGEFPFPVTKSSVEVVDEKELLSSYSELEIEAITGLVELRKQKADHPISYLPTSPADADSEKDRNV